MSPSHHPEDTTQPGADGADDEPQAPTDDDAATPDPDRAVGDFGEGTQSDAGGDSDVDSSADR